MKDKLNFSVTKPLDIELPMATERKDSRRGYITYGEDNLFPQGIKTLFLKSAIEESIIRSIKDYVMGDCIEPSMLIENACKINGDFDTLEDVIEKAVFDYILFDGFALQIIRDGFGRIHDIYNLDFENCRLSVNGDEIYYQENWERITDKPKKYPRFTRDSMFGNSVFYYKGVTAAKSACYPIPSYIGALSDIRTSTEISTFHLNSVLNDFNSSCIINFNSGYVDEATAKSIERKIEDKFAGASNAGKFMLNFNDNKETAVTVERLQSDDFDKRYEQLAKQVISNIFTAFRCTPTLCGLLTEQNGFNAQEYQEAFKIFNKTVISPIQKRIIRAFGVVFGLEAPFEIKPFSIDWGE